MPGGETGEGAFGTWLVEEELPYVRGISLTEFARQIGVETSTIYRWQERDPRPNMVGKVARGLGLDVRELTERFPTLAPKKKRQRRQPDGETDAARRQRAVEELAAYPEDVYREFMREVEEKRRRQADNRKGSEH